MLTVGSVVAICAVLYIVLIVVTIVILKKTVGNAGADERFASALNKALTESSLSCFYIDLEKNSYIVINAADNVKEHLDDSLGAREMIAELTEIFVNSAYMPKMVDFASVKTVENRLRNKNMITAEFLSSVSDKDYCRAMFVPVQRRPDGSVATVLFMVHRIDREIMWLRERLGIEETLLECVRTLTEAKDFDNAIENLLRILGEFYAADRVYLLCLDEKKSIVTKSYEWCIPGVECVAQNIKVYPPHFFDKLRSICMERGYVWVEDAEEFKRLSPPDAVLIPQGIKSFLSVPGMNEMREITHIIGIDNPRNNEDTDSLVLSITSFVKEEMIKKQTRDKLYDLSFRDTMTGLLNRHAYISQIEEYNAACQKNLGILFADVNGLKRANDTHGHEAGDRLIKEAANALISHFPTAKIYRIGGDEFVVFDPVVEENDFNEKIEKLLHDLGTLPIISVGEVWIDMCCDLEIQIKAADKKMYERKREYYQKSGIDRRRR